MPVHILCDMQSASYFQAVSVQGQVCVMQKHNSIGILVQLLAGKSSLVDPIFTHGVKTIYI